MFADGTRKEEADYKYKYENGLLVKYGKELTGSDITGEYIGIGRFSKDFMPEFMEKLDGMIRTQQHSVWWENILYERVAAPGICGGDGRPVLGRGGLCGGL